MVESNLKTEQAKIQRVKQFQVKIDKEQSSFKCKKIQEIEDELKKFDVKAFSQDPIEDKMPVKKVVISQDKMTSIDYSFLKGHFTGNFLFDNAKKIKIDEDA